MGEGNWFFWVISAVLVGMIFVLPLFTKRKQQAQVSNMLGSIKIGDKIKTVGGIIGVVVSIEEVEATAPAQMGQPAMPEREFVIETGGDQKTQLRLDIHAIYQIMKRDGAAEPVADSTVAEETVAEEEGAEKGAAEELAEADAKAEETPASDFLKQVRERE